MYFALRFFVYSYFSMATTQWKNFLKIYSSSPVIIPHPTPLPFNIKITTSQSNIKKVWRLFIWSTCKQTFLQRNVKNDFHSTSRLIRPSPGKQNESYNVYNPHNHSWHLYLSTSPTLSYFCAYHDCAVGFPGYHLYWTERYDVKRTLSKTCQKAIERQNREACRANAKPLSSKKKVSFSVYLLVSCSKNKNTREIDCINPG